MLRKFVLALSIGWIACGIARSETPPTAVFNVNDYGAVTDGTTMTAALQKAIDACAKAGGGRVEIPAGTYLTGPIHLSSNLDLHLDAGAIVLFSRNCDDYPLIYSDFNGPNTVDCTSPITGDNLHDVSITGSGTFDGQGDAWRPVKKEKLTKDEWTKLVQSGGVVDHATSTWFPSPNSIRDAEQLKKAQEGRSPQTLEAFQPFHQLLRPALMSLNNCRDVLLVGPTFRNSPNWNIHPYLCTNVTVRSVTIFNPAYAQNGDGIDFDSCSNVTMTDSTINAGDDAICLKSGRDEAGRKLHRPTEHAVISYCMIGTGHGGITIGSEMSGDVRDVTVSHCDLNGTDGGLRFKTARGRGGVVENIRISDIHMANIRQGAIEFDMYYGIKKPAMRPETVSDGTPQFHDFHISNVTCDSAQTALNLRGLPEMPIAGITFENVHVTAEKPGQIINAKDITLKGVEIRTPSNAKVQIQNVRNLVTQEVQGIALVRP
ncbi:MAG: glycoside hydrolase family 28 protein [Tepidisphaeraceae bacterium]|jgi:DNA sulfur modification protein DndE